MLYLLPVIFTFQSPLSRPGRLFRSGISAPLLALIFLVSLPAVSLTASQGKTSDDAFAIYAEGMDAAKKGRNEEAAEKLAQAAAMLPTWEEVHFNLGAVYAQLGRWDDAVKSYLKAHEAGPENPKNLINLGTAYMQLQNFNFAQDAFTRAIALDPPNVNARMNLGIARLYLERPDLATEQYKELLKLDVDTAEELKVMIDDFDIIWEKYKKETGVTAPAE